jgi:hypothetical protein
MTKPFSRRLSRRASRWIMAFSILTGSAGLAAIVSVGTTASADPSFTSAIVGVGSDVTQDVNAGLSGESPEPPTTQAPNFFDPITSTTGTNSETIASFDASPPGADGNTSDPGCIITKVGGPSFDRPNSSTAGITALLDAVNDTGFENTSASCTGTPVDVSGEINFARSARGPKSGGSTLTFIPYAQDGLGILVYDHGADDFDSGGGLSTAQLTSLYSSSTGKITVGTQTVYGCLPIAGSAPRSQLETVLDISDSTATTAATAAGCNSITQNSGNAFATFFTGLGTNDDAVIPISAGSWIGQANQVGLDRSNTARSDGAYLAEVNSIQPTTGTAPSLVPNTAYYESTFGYPVFEVVPTENLSGFGENAAEVDLFENEICKTTVQSIVHQFGFDTLQGSEDTCGETTVTGDS